MKIAFYAPLKPIDHPNPSGDRIIAQGLYDFFKEKDQELVVISKFRSRWFYHSIKKLMKWPIEMLKAFVKLIDQRPDFFFTYHMYYKAPDPIAPFLSWFFNRPYFIYEGMFAHNPSKKIKTLPGYLLTITALNRCSHVFTDKSDDYINLIRYLPENQVTYIAPAIDLDFLTPCEKLKNEQRERRGVSSDTVLISSIAMLRPDRKTEGVQFLLKCLSTLKEKGLDFILIHAGGGDCYQQIKNEGNELLGDRFIALGNQSKDEIKELLNMSDVFAFPGIDEGFGMVYVEAQAMENPVVALNNGGIPDAVDQDKSAFLTEFMSEEAYTNALEKLIIDKELRQRMGKNGRQYVDENHNRSKNYERMWRIIQAKTKRS